ncbi:putative inorganic phosphate transporter 1-5 [Camellia lanceoleosa]|uniref:Inorganic phosphate transporter 1-5 n=1 Tax=Camellia lanceoleosa TaxID=1840588 RepID=A0ACC0GV97_9ERIC|nr:putative inorganic phosphate transporter 1-5 [Camellia lanceoleosa]
MRHHPCFRFWLGFGIGGNYPLLATIMTEYANKKICGAFIAAVFAMQGFGILASGIVALIVSSAFDHAYKAFAYSVGPVASTMPQADYIWRIVLMFEALLATLTYYWQMKMPKTVCYTALVAKNVKQEAQDMSKVLNVEINLKRPKSESASRADPDYGLFSKEFLNHHGVHLLGTTSTWFLLDIAFYSQNLFQKDIVIAIWWIPSAVSMNSAHEVETNLPWNISCDRKGRCYCWYIGFLYAAQSQDSKKTDAGYPAGIAVKNSLIVLGCINFLGMLFTFCVPEPKGKSLEELSGENEDDSGVPSEQQADSSRTGTV